MHKSSHFRALFEFDPDIERTSHKLKRQLASQEEPTASMMAGGEDVQQRTLWDYVTLGLIAKLQT